MQSLPVRILFAVPELDRAGPDRVMFELLRGLDPRRFVPMLMVSRAGGYYFSRLPSHVHVTVLPPAPILPRYPLVSALQHVRRCVPDIVFATLRMTITLGLVAGAFPRHTKLVLRQANDVSSVFEGLAKTSPLKHQVARRIASFSFSRANTVVCQSEAMKRDLRGFLGASADLHVIGNPIDVAEIARLSSSRVSLPGTPALVSVGRLAAQKGYDLLLPALAALRRAHPNAHLTIFGEGPDRPALTRLVEHLGLGEHVTFRGFTADVLPSVRAADLFVLCSRYEGFPNAALEALACGTPVVLTDCPGANAQIVRTGQNGRLAVSVESDAFATAMELALRELATYSRQEISDDCEQRFGARRIVDAYQELFLASLATERRSRMEYPT
jgi:glycosyltransferase involved in cell wall biosynthesis